MESLLLERLLSGPYAHFKKLGEDDWRDPAAKNPGLSLSSKGWYDHKNLQSGSLETLAKQHGYSAAAANYETSVWERSTKVQPGSSEWNAITGYFTSHRCIPEDHYADLLESGLIRLNEHNGERMVVYPALDWENFEALREGKPHQVKRLQRIFLNRDNSKKSKKHLGKAQAPFAFIALPLNGNHQSKEILVVEGLEDGLSLRKLFAEARLIVSSDKGSLKHCAPILEQFEKVLIIADNDPDGGGQKAAWNLKQSLTKPVEVETKMPPTEKDDANQALQEGRLQAWRDELIELPERFQMRPASSAARYTLLQSHEISGLPNVQWTVKGIVPTQGVVFVYGPSGAGKSFLAMDMAFAICKGKEWFGHKTKSTPVVYIVLEGAAGIKQRVSAWERYHNEEAPSNLNFIMDPVNLRSAEDVAELSDAIQQALLKGCVVMVDTYSQATAGSDENSAKDTGEVLQQVKKLQTDLEGLVLLVGHTGKDASKGLRGSSAMFAALDAAIEVEGTKSPRSWKTTKVKDGAAGKEHGFRLHSVHLGEDEDGDEISSCVIAPQELLKATQDGKSKLSGDARLCCSALKELTPDPQQPVEVPLEAWKQAFFSKVSERGEEAQSKAFRRSKSKLLEDGHICEGNEPDTFILAGQSGHVRDMSAMS
jgi:5S rRNA maturation endonuclease (ribonuclease M5)